jgi:GNAT superfamily N-acetyltransferase
MQIEEHRRDDFLISTDKSRLDVDAVHAFLSRSFWAQEIPREIVARSIEGSLCFGIYQGDQQVGFARVISDFATYAYLADVYVLEEFRGRGLSKWLMECIMHHPDLQGLKRWSLNTRDAHGLYTKYGFQPAAYPERMMEILDFDIYKRDAPAKRAN